MKGFIHARLDAGARALLDRLKRATGLSESELVRRGLALLARETDQRSALQAAGDRVGKFRGGPPDLSTNPEHLDGFGR